MVRVTVDPKTADVPAGSTLRFTASVSGDSTNAGVTWKTSSGKIDPTGLYTSTSGPQTAVTITATSVADTTKSDTATVS